MTVSAGMIKYIHDRREDVCSRKQYRTNSMLGFMWEAVYKYRRKEPNEKQTGYRNALDRTAAQAVRPRDAMSYDSLAHALLDSQGGFRIPVPSARAKLAPTEGVPRCSDRIPPSTSFPRHSSGGFGSLAHPLALWRHRLSHDLAIGTH